MDEKRKSKKREAIDDHANQKVWIGLTIYDCCILGCMALNVSTKGSISAFETLGVSIAESHFNMSSARAGTIVASCGTIGVMSLLSMGYLAKYFSDIQLICGGMVVMASGIISLTTLDEDQPNEGWRYFVAIFLVYSIGYPIGHTAVIGLFSKSKLVTRASIPSALISFLKFFFFHSSISRWTKTPRRASGMVCFCRIVSKIVLSNYVRLHRQLLGNRFSLLRFDWRPSGIDGDFTVQQRNTLISVKLIRTSDDEPLHALSVSNSKRRHMDIRHIVSISDQTSRQKRYSRS